MKIAILLITATALTAQTPAQQGKQPAPPRDGIPASHGDDTKGYNDTPQLPNQKWKVHDMERPRAPKVTPGPMLSPAPPSDAIVLFDGKDLSHWVQGGRGSQTQEPKWKVENGYLEIVPRTGKLITKEKFGDCQLHVEWMIPVEATGSGQGRGNSGVELMTRYEIQVLESNQNLTYADGAAGAMYGAWPPLVNPARPQGEWNAYDIMFEAPVRRRKTRQAGLLHGALQRRARAESPGAARHHHLAPGGEIHASRRRGAPESAGPLAAGPLPQYLDPASRWLRPGRALTLDRGPRPHSKGFSSPNIVGTSSETVG